MAIIIQLNQDLEGRLKKNAAQKGVDPEQLIVKMLEEQLGEIAPTSEQVTIDEETLLLTKINAGVSGEMWDRFYQLIEKRDDNLLSEEEYQELITLTEDIEMANVKRIEYLIELAKLRKIGLEEVMAQLGIETLPYA